MMKISWSSLIVEVTEVNMGLQPWSVGPPSVHNGLKLHPRVGPVHSTSCPSINVNHAGQDFPTLLLLFRPSAWFPSMEAAATLDPVLCTSAACASSIHVLSVLKQACTGRCSVSNVHKHPMVFGSVINLQFTVKHTGPAVRAPINQHPDVCNFALMSPT